MEARVIRKYRIRVQNHRVGQVDNENENQSQYSNMSNTYIGSSLIYWNREQSIRLGVSEVQERNTGMRCYMNGRHRKAESDRNKRRDLDYKQEIGLEVGSFCDPGDLQVAWHDNDVKVVSITGLHPSLSMKHKFQESQNANESDSVTWN